MGTDGTATRYCDTSGMWSDTISTLNCVSIDYQFIQNISNVSQQVSSLAALINTTAPIHTGEIAVVLEVLNRTSELSKMELELEVSLQISMDTASVINNLVDDSNKQVLIVAQTQLQVAQTIIRVLETQTGYFASNINTEFQFDDKNLFVENRILNNSNINRITAINFGTATAPIVQVPIGTMEKEIFISVAIIRNIGEIIREFSDDITIGTKGVKLREFERNEFFVAKRIATPAVSVQIFSENKPTNSVAFEMILPLDLGEYDTDQFRMLASCLFLEEKWSDSGIVDVSTGDILQNGTIKCQPQHTTAFVALIAISRLENQSVVLNFISYVGCCVSMVSLVLSLAIYIIFGKKFLKIIYHFVHFNLAISLLLLYAIFVGGVETAYVDIWNYIPCKIVSVLTQYFLLVVFMWMLTEGLIIFVMILRPLQYFGRRYFILFLAVSYLLPVLYLMPFVPFFHQVYISPPVGLNQNGTMEGTAKYCFLHADLSNNFIILSIIVPVAFIIGLNIFIITAVAVRFIILVYRQKSISRFDRSRKTSLKLYRLFIIMFPLLGLGWLFGLLAINSQLTVFAWLFTILGSSQGFFFLIFVVLSRKDMQNAIITTLGLKSKLDTVLSQFSSQSRFGSPRTSVASQRRFSFISGKLSSISGRSSVDQSRMEHFVPRFTKIDEMPDLRTRSDLELAERAGLMPPTVDIEDLLTFIEHPPVPLCALDDIIKMEPEPISTTLEPPTIDGDTELKFTDETTDLPPTHDPEIIDLMMFYEPQRAQHEALFDSLIQELEDLIRNLDNNI